MIQLSQISLVKKAGFFPLLMVFFTLFLSNKLYAQQFPNRGATATLDNAPQRDTSKATNSSDWRDEQTVIYFKKLNSEKKYYPDTSLHSFHRRSFYQPWYRNLGNLGSPVTSLLFTPQLRTGPTLGYHTFDVYRFDVAKLNYYNTTRPYSAFSYQLGSKAEQIAEILHTQNINPRWNFAAQYRKINSPGYYKIQRNNDDMGSLSTNYTSKNQHYHLNAAFAYNKMQHDENGGIVADSFLTNSSFDDRKTIPVTLQDDQYSNRRSPVTTMQRDFNMLLLHSYTLGTTDTLYNGDSTQYYFKLIPRFSVAHRLKLGTEKYQFKDVRPDSIVYSGFFQQGFRAEDSVFTEQKWFYVDNAILLNGFLGKESKQLQFTAGIGNRVDKFRTDYGIGENSESIISNYLEGALQKEALQEGAWYYNAHAQFFFTGNAAGNFRLNADLGKEISARIGKVEAGFEQQVNNAPYNFTIYQNQYYRRTEDYNKETVTMLYGKVQNDFLKLEAGLRNYLIANYIYLDEQQHFAQYANAFNITQVWLRKSFRYGIFVLDNEVVYQQKTGNAPVNVPAVMGKHQLSIETLLFGNALKIATGIDVWWHTNYAPAAYSPFFNRFYYQSNYTVSNAPETAVFFNFKIKNFRAFLMGDQLQQFFTRNIVTAPGYPAQDAMIRFGFNWVMIN
jgi:hypothetical protein